MHKTLSTNASLPTYLLVSSAYLSIQAAVLLLFPTLLITLLSPPSTRVSLPATDLEIYLCRALGWVLATLAGFGLSCAIALGRDHDAAVAAGGNSSSDGANVADSPSPSTTATTLLLPATLIYHILATLHAYTNFSSSSSSASASGSGSGSAFLLPVLASGTLAVYGIWVGMFGSEVRVSSVDGRDKRTSGFLFGGGGNKKAL